MKQRFSGQTENVDESEDDTEHTSPHRAEPCYREMGDEEVSNKRQKSTGTLLKCSVCVLTRCVDQLWQVNSGKVNQIIQISQISFVPNFDNPLNPLSDLYFV